jgi:hypothetical protein
MLTGVPTVTDEEMNAHFRAVQTILNVPCPDCGKPYPCPCDEHLFQLSVRTNHDTLVPIETVRTPVQPRNADLGELAR